jgi:hypothetical protein
MKKYHYFIYPFFLFFYFQIISFYFNPVYDLFVDYGYYFSAVERFWANDIIYQNSFVYLTGFFILTPVMLNIYMYLILLLISFVIPFILLVKLEEKYWMVVFVLTLPVLYVYNGNIDPFIFMIILICLYYSKENEYLAPILLAFVSFKPNVVFVIPYFLYISKKRIKFIILYLVFLILFNINLILQFNVIFEYLEYVLFDWHQGHSMDYIRPYWIYYVYYFGLKEKYLKSEFFMSKLDENSFN